MQPSRHRRQVELAISKKTDFEREHIVSMVAALLNALPVEGPMRERLTAQLCWVLDGDTSRAMAHEASHPMAEQARAGMDSFSASIYAHLGMLAWRALFGFVCPGPLFIDTLRDRVATGLLEIGAGSGHLTRLAQMANIDAVASDLYAPQNNPVLARAISSALESAPGDAPLEPGATGHFGWTDVAPMAADEAVLLHPERDVLLAWPTYQGDWPVPALTAMRPGRLLFLIGEGPGGCTGSQAVEDVLQTVFRTITPHVEGAVLAFPGMHDRLSIHERLE